MIPALDRLFTRLEYANHRVDEYLARMRGDHLTAADCQSRAELCMSRLFRLQIQKGH